ncbi:hypothetical protein FJZ55_08695 [Candidatus Woesearchaeota archaeon]|nr:hypothetical protein [Candidatus Woesearchaeota archaeon]
MSEQQELSLNYYPNGSKMSSYCYQTGEFKKYQENGKLEYLCFYKNFKYHGTYQKYNNDEQVIKKLNYIDGILESYETFQYGVDKKIIVICRYNRLDQDHGIREEYEHNRNKYKFSLYENGMLKSYKIYSLNKISTEVIYDPICKSEKWRYFNEQEKLIKEFDILYKQYTYGPKYVGKVEHFNEDGTLIKTEYYDDNGKKKDSDLSNKLLVHDSDTNEYKVFDPYGKLLYICVYDDSKLVKYIAYDDKNRIIQCDNSSESKKFTYCDDGTIRSETHILGNKKTHIEHLTKFYKLVTIYVDDKIHEEQCFNQDKLESSKVYTKDNYYKYESYYPNSKPHEKYEYDITTKTEYEYTKWLSDGSSIYITQITNYKVIGVKKFYDSLGKLCTLFG